jgi:branched-subunit amino acid aminotransferase/4-amino-4-deoxychorismate lyase
MIWVAGRLVADQGLTIPALDRSFEHGFGLFETFRTWNGHATLLRRHLARLTRSAAELGLPVDPGVLPDERAVDELLRAEHATGDRMLRITLSGGLSATAGSTIWMRAAPLPSPARSGGAMLAEPWEVARADRLARYKSLNYWRRRLVYEDAREKGFDEALSMTPDGYYWEGCRTNLFLVMGSILTTPHLDGPLVPGIMREVVRERALDLGMDAREGEISRKVFPMVQEAFLTNSVRGIIPLARLGHKLNVPGPVTTRLWESVLAWLERGEDR